MKGNGYSTSILYFDEQYSFGSIPAPLTSWPPGYSYAIAFVSQGGLTEESSGKAISLISYLLLFPLLYILLINTTRSDFAASLACIWLMSATGMWLYATSVLSEMMFTLGGLAVFFVLSSNLRRERKWFVASLLAGIVFSVRYNGVFLLIFVFLYSFLDTLMYKKEKPNWLGLLYSWLPGALIFIFIIGRNLLLTGGITGGNNKVVSNPLLPLLKTILGAFVDLTFGFDFQDISSPSTYKNFLFLAFVLILSIFTIIMIDVLRYVVNSCIRLAHISVPIMVYIFIYVIGVTWFQKTTIISHGDRYYVPLVPLFIAISTMLLNSGRIGRFTDSNGHSTLAVTFVTRERVLSCICLLLVFFAQMHSIPRRLNRDDKTDREPVNWIIKHTSEHEVIMAIGDGQRTGYYSRRATVVVPYSHYTSIEWGEAQIRHVVKHYDVKTIVISTKISKDISNEEGETPFVRGLKTGIHPSWMTCIASLKGAIIYRVNKFS